MSTWTARSLLANFAAHQSHRHGSCIPEGEKRGRLSTPGSSVAECARRSPSERDRASFHGPSRKFPSFSRSVVRLFFAQHERQDAGQKGRRRRGHVREVRRTSVLGAYVEKRRRRKRACLTSLSSILPFISQSHLRPQLLCNCVPFAHPKKESSPQASSACTPHAAGSRGVVIAAAANAPLAPRWPSRSRW